MALKTRTIQTTSRATNTGDLKLGAETVFPVLTDTGAGKGTIVSATLTVSAMRSYSTQYTLSVSYGGVALASTDNPGAFDTVKTLVLPLNSISERLLTDAAESIVLTPQGSGTGVKCNFREGCYLTLEIIYEEPDEPQNVRFWNGSAWQPCKVQYYTGSAWLPCQTKYSPDGQTFQ